MRTELGLVLKHVDGEVEKVNVVNYFTRPPPRWSSIFMKRVCMYLLIRGGVSDQIPKVPTQIISTKVIETRVRTIEITTERANMCGMGTIIATTISIRTTLEIEMRELEHLCSSSK